MQCPKCESEAYVAKKEGKRPNQGEPLTEYRTYVCSNWDCLHGFVYRNRYLNDTERMDTARWLKSYERRKADAAAGQGDMFEENE